MGGLLGGGRGGGKGYVAPPPPKLWGGCPPPPSLPTPMVYLLNIADVQLAKSICGTKSEQEKNSVQEITSPL